MVALTRESVTLVLSLLVYNRTCLHSVRLQVMKRTRSQSYTRGDASETSTTISRALMPWTQSIVAARGSLYPSLDMRGPAQMDSLRQHAGLVKSLVEVDDRGGIFSQTSMCQAMLLVLAASPDKEALLSTGRELGKTREELAQLLAYQVRVMLAHVRMTFDSSIKHDLESPRDDVFDIMKLEKKPSTPKSRRVKRLGDRPRPFVLFRSDAAGSEERAEDEEAEVVVSRYLDYSELVARCLYSSGRVENADKYACGGDGMATASWLSTGETIALDVPDSFVSTGGKALKRPKEPDKKQKKTGSQEKRQEQK